MSWRDPDRNPTCFKDMATRCSTGKPSRKSWTKPKKHSALLQSKLDGAFTQYHNEVQEMQAKGDELVWKNKSLHQKNKGMLSSNPLSTDWGTLL
jgi:hypothetical protein